MARLLQPYRHVDNLYGPFRPEVLTEDEHFHAEVRNFMRLARRSDLVSAHRQKSSNDPVTKRECSDPGGKLSEIPESSQVQLPVEVFGLVFRRKSGVDYISPPCRNRRVGARFAYAITDRDSAR